MPTYKLQLPSMGESVSEATITQWLKKVGEKVKADEPVVEVATDKVDSEIVSEHNGIIKEILCNVNDIVTVNTTIALIETEDLIEDDDKFEEINEISSLDESISPEIYIKKADDILEVNNNTISSNSERFYSPLVKSIAKKENISIQELDKIIGTGKDKRVTKNDIIEFINQKNASDNLTENKNNDIVDTINKKDLEENIVPLSRMEDIISKHMVNSLKTSAHVQSFIEIDVTKIWNWREKLKNNFFDMHNVKLTFTPIFINIISQIIPEFPIINSSFDGKNIHFKKDINIGMATAIKDGTLIVPVIKNTNLLSLTGVAKKVNELSINARSSKLNPDDVQEGTFTVSNIGMFGSLTGTPIINQPQLAVLALGAIRKIPSVVETDFGDAIAIRKKMVVSLSYVHRVINGATGGKFIARLKEVIENWEENNNI